MSATIRRIMPLALCVLGFAGPASAQSRDPLPDVRARLKIEAQRVEKEIHDGRMRAYRLLRSDPDAAYDLIKGLIGMLRKDTSLSEERNKLLARTLQRDIDNLRALASVRRSSAPALNAAHAETRPTMPPRPGLDKESPDKVAERIIRSRSGQVAESRRIRERSGDRFKGVIAKVDESATPAASDYDLPPDWLEKSKKRSPAAKLTAQEKALLAALKKPVKVDYNMATFQSVIDDLSKKLGQNILIDKRTLEEVGITYDSPITLRFNNPVSARTALKRVLADVGLTYVIRKENIEVTTVERAREMLTTRTYYLGDLVGVANPLLPGVVNQFQMMQAIGSIVNQIKGIDPESWDGNGGPGTISFDPIRMVLVIKQSAEMHYMLNGGGR